MPGHPLHVGAVVSCPHQGKATPATSQPRVRVAGQAVTTAASSYLIAGCTLAGQTPPHPCTSIRWTAPATRVRVMGSPLLIDGPGGICLAGAVPQGPTSFSAVQMRVTAQ